MTPDELFDRAADDILARLGEDATFQAGIDEDPVTCLIAFDRDRRAAQDHMGISEADLTISMKHENISTLPVPDQEVAVNGEWYYVQKTSTHGPWVDFELVRKES